MKYFMGATVVADDGRLYDVCAMYVARSEKAATELLKTRTSTFTGEEGIRIRLDTWRFDKASIVCSVGDLKEISYAAFSELKDRFPVFTETAAEAVPEKDYSGNVKDIAHKLGTQLKRLEAPVAHCKLLEAVSASFGDTDWAVALHKKAPSKPAALPPGVRVKAQPMGAGPYARYWSFVGFVNDLEVIVVNNHVMGQWRVGSNLAWTGTLEEATLFNACVAETLRLAKLKAEELTQMSANPTTILV